jgi:BirA family biotin operon repressor/biotin-[acetyl-CoA-carboxylase] ligase
MRVGTEWLVLESVGSTQSEAARLLALGGAPDVLLAKDQLAGRGRLGRSWESEPGCSLTMSLVLREYSGHPSPWLLGMLAAIAAARVLQGRVRWPNDVFAAEGKVAGILTEIWPDQDGRACPVVGVGANLRPFRLSAGLAAGFDPRRRGAEEAAQDIVEELRRCPEPVSWESIEAQWRELDDTPGKLYRLPSGATVTATRVGPGGALLAESEAGPVRVLAAEALLPPG